MSGASSHFVGAIAVSVASTSQPLKARAEVCIQRARVVDARAREGFAQFFGEQTYILAQTWSLAKCTPLSMRTWARVEASRHDHTARTTLMQAPTSQLVRKRVEKERIERAFRLQDRDGSGVIEGRSCARARRARPAERRRLDPRGARTARSRPRAASTCGSSRRPCARGGRRVRQAALDDEETRKRRELRAQRSRRPTFRQLPEDDAAGERAGSWAGSQFANHLTLRGPETDSRAEIHASNERDRIERERRQWIRAKAGVSGAPKSEVELLRQDYIAVRRRNSPRIRRQFGAQFAAPPSPTPLRPPVCRPANPMRGARATGARRRRRRRAHRQRDRQPWNVPSPPRDHPRRRKGAPLPFESTVTDQPRRLPRGHPLGLLHRRRRRREGVPTAASVELHVRRPPPDADGARIDAAPTRGGPPLVSPAAIAEVASIVDDAGSAGAISRVVRGGARCRVARDGGWLGGVRRQGRQGAQ